MCAVNSRDFGVSGSTCPGDSGSPLVTWDEQNDGWTLIGVLSNGARSCFQGMPEVYTEVVSYLRWIQETMERHEREDIQTKIHTYSTHFLTSNKSHHHSEHST